MKAAQARQLKIGDFVRARFGGRGTIKMAEITAINWPTFTLRMIDSRGREMVRTRLYPTIIDQCAANRPPSTAPLPSWLKYDRRGDFNHRE